MTKSQIERSAKLRNSREVDGMKQKAVWVDYESLQLIEGIVSRTGSTRQDIMLDSMKRGLEVIVEESVTSNTDSSTLNSTP